MSFACVRGPGQPDVACDLVAASIVEEYLRRDAASRTNLRVAGGQGVLFVAGEVSSSADFDVSAVARRTLGACGVMATLEPFIAIEPMSAAWTQPIGSRETLTLTAYATSETPERLPLARALAQRIARGIETKRTRDADWFWCGSDFEVAVELQGRETLVIVRAEHVDAKTLLEVRPQIENVVREVAPEADIRVNPAGEESAAGLAKRVGSSGQNNSAEMYGAALPASRSGVGYHLVHPLNLGAWLLRSVAREAISRELGKAVLVQATWLPLEARPHRIRIRNERGQDLSIHFSLERFDVTKPPAEFLQPSLITASLRSPFDETVSLPWERE